VHDVDLAARLPEDPHRRGTMTTRSLRITMICLTVLGLAVASYLTIEHFTGGTTICPLHGGCETVQHSIYSKLASMPVALIGLIGYIAILASLLAPRNETTRLATMTFTVIGFGFSAYLTFRELFSIHAICPWCVSSAIIMTLLSCLAVWSFLRGDDSLIEDPDAIRSEPDTGSPLTATGS
jgi:uncharacterized membrane protein